MTHLYPISMRRLENYFLVNENLGMRWRHDGKISRLIGMTSKFYLDHTHNIGERSNRIFLKTANTVNTTSRKMCLYKSWMITVINTWRTTEIFKNHFTRPFAINFRIISERIYLECVGCALESPYSLNRISPKYFVDRFIIDLLMRELRGCQ